MVIRAGLLRTRGKPKHRTQDEYDGLPSFQEIEMIGVRGLWDRVEKVKLKLAWADGEESVAYR